MTDITETDISSLVTLFYARVKTDPLLSPIFIGKIGYDDEAWAKHVLHIGDFWSSIFLKTKRFTGNPMTKHIALQGVTPEHFDHWLSLFKETAVETLGREKADVIMTMANRIAQSLQMGLAFGYENAGVPDHPFMEFGLTRRRANRL